PYFTYLVADTSWTNIMARPLVYFLVGFCGLAIWLAFAMIAFQVFITYIEFYICSALMLLFMPFATNKYTDKFAQNCIGGVFSHGVKLMFLGAIISLSGPIINSLNTNFQGTPTWDHLFSSLLAPWAIAFLCWQAPSMAAGFMSGGPALSMATAASNTMAGASMTAGAIATGFGMAKGMANAAGSAVKAGTTLAGAAAAGVSAVAEFGTGAVSAAAGGVSTYAGAKAKDAFNNYVKEPMQESWNKGYTRVATEGTDSSGGNSMGQGDFSK
ncbi:MAG: type IV secretion system protein, partial [Phascolarctobacterium sp.]|nr:type IV secretion system protein [Phascolarctobacterium sp.]